MKKLSAKMGQLQLQLLKDLARVNPRFYPIPIKPHPTRREDGAIVPELVLDGYLTPKDFELAYEACHGILHATNPYRDERNMTAMSTKLKTWHTLIVQLLNIHEVHFVDQKSMWVINMQEEKDDHVHFYEFELIESQ